MIYMYHTDKRPSSLFLFISFPDFKIILNKARCANQIFKKNEVDKQGSTLNTKSLSLQRKKPTNLTTSAT